MRINFINLIVTCNFKFVINFTQLVLFRYTSNITVIFFFQRTTVRPRHNLPYFQDDSQLKFMKWFAVHIQLIEILQPKSSNHHQTSFSAEDQTASGNPFPWFGPGTRTNASQTAWSGIQSSHSTNGPSLLHLFQTAWHHMTIFPAGLRKMNLKYFNINIVTTTLKFCNKFVALEQELPPLSCLRCKLSV